MTDREKLELAAKACGLKYKIDYEGTILELFEDGHAEWSPLTDQADSDRMGCKLRTEIVFLDGRVQTRDPRTCGVLYVTHDNTDEDVFRAVREARLLVAAEIGRLK